MATNLTLTAPRPNPARAPAVHGPYLTAEHAHEFRLCALDFWYWSRRYVYVQALEEGRRVLFEPYPSQTLIVNDLLAREWLLVVKARRLGATTCILVWMLWKAIFDPPFNADIVSKKEPVAIGLLEMYRKIEIMLPEWMRPVLSKESSTKREYGLLDSSIHVIVSGKGAARSEGLHFLLADEAAFIEGLNDTLQAAQPTLETSGGQAAIVSTSDGPANDFHGGVIVAQAGRSRYRLIFLDWTMRPGRDAEWYAKEERENAHIPGYMHREYPRNIKEAFELAGSRVYEGFRRDSHIVHVDFPGPAVGLYRSIDFGNSAHHPFTCLWAWHDKHSNPKLTVEPDSEVIHCSAAITDKYPDGVDQMMAYRRKKDTGALIKNHDDWPDALRYMITFYRLLGHLHVYRTLVVRLDTDFQMSPHDMFREVQTMSGMVCTNWSTNHWERGPDAETYVGTVCDVHDSGWIRTARTQNAPEGFGMDIVGFDPPEGLTRSVEQGIVLVNNLVLGTDTVEVTEEIDDHTRDYRRFEAGEQPQDLREAVRFKMWEVTRDNSRDSGSGIGRHRVWKR